MSKIKRPVGLVKRVRTLFTDESPTVTFEFEDGSKQVQNISNSFLTYHNGGRRNVNQVTDDLLAIQEDMGAIRVTI